MTNEVEAESAEMKRAAPRFAWTWLTSTKTLLAYLGIADFVLHMLFAGNYGYFRDELYYIVSGTQHLSLGYVDFPPLVAYVAALLNPVAKDSLLAIHVVPAVNESVLVFLAGMIARELGGGRKAQLLAAVSTLLSLVFLLGGSLFTPDSFDQVWWSLFAYLAIRVVKRHEPKLWVAAGLVFGIGLLTKLTIAFFVVVLLATFLAMPSARRHLQSKWVLVGGLLSVAFVIPMLYWNFANGWPMLHFYLEFKGDVSGGGPLSFLYTQLALISFVNTPIFVIGLFFFLRPRSGGELRPFGVTYLVLYAFMTILDMKPYYLASIYPLLFAGGAIMIERSSVSRRGAHRWFGSRPYVACLIVAAILVAPIAIPIFPPSAVVNSYGSSSYQLVLADKYGWSKMVTNVSQLYDNLPASERSHACIFTSNYGEASAVNFFGRELGLPEAISGHNNYYIWGPDSCTGHVLMTIGVSLTVAQQSQANATLLGTLTCGYCINYEQSLPIYLLVNQSTSIASTWPLLGHYD